MDRTNSTGNPTDGKTFPRAERGSVSPVRESPAGAAERTARGGWEAGAQKATLRIRQSTRKSQTKLHICGEALLIRERGSVRTWKPGAFICLEIMRRGTRTREGKRGNRVPELGTEKSVHTSRPSRPRRRRHLRQSTRQDPSFTREINRRRLRSLAKPTGQGDEEGTRERQEPRGPWTKRGERQTAAQPSLPFVYGSKGRAVLGRECCGRESIQEHSVLWRGVRACGAEGSGEGAKETGEAGREGAAGGTGWSGGRAGAGDWTERGEKGNGMEGEGVQLVGPPPAGPIHFVAVLGGSLLLREIGLGRWLYHVGFVY